MTSIVIFLKNLPFTFSTPKFRDLSSKAWVLMGTFLLVFLVFLLICNSLCKILPERFPRNKSHHAVHLLKPSVSYLCCKSKLLSSRNGPSSTQWDVQLLKLYSCSLMPLLQNIWFLSHQLGQLCAGLFLRMKFSFLCDPTATGFYCVQQFVRNTPEFLSQTGTSLLHTFERFMCSFSASLILFKADTMIPTYL